MESIVHCSKKKESVTSADNSRMCDTSEKGGGVTSAALPAYLPAFAPRSNSYSVTREFMMLIDFFDMPIFGWT